MIFFADDMIIYIKNKI